MCGIIKYALLCIFLLVPSTAYGDDFVFARLKYRGFQDDTYLKNWYTDYPEMDIHAVQIINRLTNIHATSRTVTPSDKALFGLPFIYTVEPEQMNLTDFDIVNLRRYFKRGGFMFADDYHGDEELLVFQKLIHRILPTAITTELDTKHEIFHTFYDIQAIQQVLNDGVLACKPDCVQWENGPSGEIPRIFAVYLDNRMVILATWNTDIGDGLQFLDDPKYPRAMASYAVRLLLNVIIFSLTH